MNEYECECDEINELMTLLPVRVDGWVRVIRWMGGCVGEVKKITFEKKSSAHLGAINYQCQRHAQERKIKNPRYGRAKMYDHRTPCDGHLFV